MSEASKDNMATEDMVTITVDGQVMQARKGAMLIEVTDAHQIKVPRFCYHKKLAVAANCRMCLVEVEKAPKPLPACATPVMDGMVVHTQSKFAKDAQKSVMEFLLINHPLDCPICDQGGECELQDVAMGYGRDVSQYVESKRVVLDKSIGPLIATELTRCIHCTRCVRFGREIAGIRELGMTGRGEHALISTFVDECVNSEMSGNSVDVCPVGALTAKPSRFAARAWEMVQHKTIAAHDCIGSNLYVHTLRGEVIRVVPRENEAINEVWLSDRDRFSYEGLDTPDRLTTPMIKRDGQWQAADWDEALKLVAENFKTAAELKAKQLAAQAHDTDESEAIGAESDVVKVDGAEMAALVSANATLEELYLAQKLLRGLGSGNIDFRLRQSDFSDQDIAPVMPWLGQDIEQLEKLDAALLIGSNVRKEQPIANLRLRKATVNNNAQISFLNPRRYDFNFPLANNVVVAQQHLPAELIAIAAAVYQLTGSAAPKNLATAIAKAEIGENHKTIAQQLIAAKNASVLLGNIAQMHPQFSALRVTAAAIAKETGSTFGYLSDGCNAAGAWLSGAVPHRGAAGNTENVITGKHLAELYGEKLAACLLLDIEPDTDAANAGELMAMLHRADFVVAVTAYNSASLKKTADVMLPAASFTETSGTYVNAEGSWQSFNAVVEAKGGARPAWKILRVLGNLTGVQGFDYISSEEVKNELRSQCESIELSNAVDSKKAVKIVAATKDIYRSSDVPMYAGDAVVRRAKSLQKTIDAQTLCVRLNAAEADRLGVAAATLVTVKQGDKQASMKLVIDDNIPDASAWIPMAVEGCDSLGAAFAAVSIENAGAETAATKTATSKTAATDTGLGA
jgi:NADH-quinone oxidoreductase subunit G